MNTPEARQVLAEVITTRKLDNDDEQSARCHAIESLGNSGDVSYIAFLEPYVPRTNTCEGLYAMTAIAKLGQGSVVSVLQAQLQSPVEKQRWWAIRALRITNSPDAVDAIITALRDKDPEIRAHAATSLTELTGHSVTSGKQLLTPIQLESAWLAWWHDHRHSTKINNYPGELCVVHFEAAETAGGVRADLPDCHFELRSTMTLRSSGEARPPDRGGRTTAGAGGLTHPTMR